MKRDLQSPDSQSLCVYFGEGELAMRKKRKVRDNFGKVILPYGEPLCDNCHLCRRRFRDCEGQE